MPRKKITHLTPEQDAVLPVVRDEWLTIGWSTGDPDKARAVMSGGIAGQKTRITALLSVVPRISA